MNPIERAISGAIVAILSFGLFLPIGLAIGRNHPRASAVFAWNTIGLAAFGIGWFVALWLVTRQSRNSSESSLPGPTEAAL